MVSIKSIHVAHSRRYQCAIHIDVVAKIKRKVHFHSACNPDRVTSAEHTTTSRLTLKCFSCVMLSQFDRALLDINYFRKEHLR